MKPDRNDGHRGPEEDSGGKGWSGLLKAGLFLGAILLLHFIAERQKARDDGKDKSGPDPHDL